MKIAFMMDQFPRLTETYFLDQMTGLLRAGHQIDIIATTPSGQPKMHPDVVRYDLLGRTRYIGLETAFPLNRPWQVLRALGLVIKNFHRAPRIITQALCFWKYDCKTLDIYLRVIHTAIAFSQGERNYDIIHCHLGPVGLTGVSLRQLGIISGKIVTTFHSADAYVYPHRWGKKVNVYEKLWAWMDLCTVCSEYMRNTLIALGASGEKIRKLPVGLDFGQFIFKERRLAADGVVRIVTVARLAEKKGLEYAIQAIAKVCEWCPGVQLTYKIAGEGPERPKLEHLIKELGLEEKVVLLGWCAQPEVTALLETAHLFVLPSVTARDGNKEGQALVVQEAQAVGLPLVTTIHNGIPEGLIDGKSGFLVPERDAEAMAQKLRYLILNPELWPVMGAAGRAFVEQHYNIDALNQELLTFYGEISHP